ncbi:MAG: DUF484 family protein [Gammaproteobacteria bacterium]|jgi:hypothetical protein|nr:hypothetical protein [Chromatiales bacterium]MCP4511382.1 DUF484 family protein [Fuerstiella sp.]MCP4926699.1 DUF484 family protein [Gammaproteobacteria bacterium]MDP7297074.1 DUF484 family protein [Gammaproteobacteria bacterium]MDP7660209.1 DUF484 family protein [Gammaproteobacteria bacterium]
MNTVEQAESIPVEHNDEAIIEYLRANPEFFIRNSDLLADLRLPHSTGGTAISLVERQVSVLRGRHERIEAKLRDFMQVAQSNNKIANNIHELAILLMQAVEYEAVIATLEDQLLTTFSADRPVLVLFGKEPVVSADGQFLRRVSREDPSMGPFKTFLQASQARCGTVRDAQRNFLFGEADIEVGSVALIPLGENAAVGFLAIGCRDPDHFHPGKSIDFLTRIGELVAAALAR